MNRRKINPNGSNIYSSERFRNNISELQNIAQKKT